LPDGSNLNREIVRAVFGWWYVSFRQSCLNRDGSGEALCRTGLTAFASGSHSDEERVPLDVVCQSLLAARRGRSRPAVRG
jgi:hypothetical protein